MILEELHRMARNSTYGEFESAIRRVLEDVPATVINCDVKIGFVAKSKTNH